MPSPSDMDSINRGPVESTLHIATAPVNWNNFELPNLRPFVPFPEILDRMVEAGYRSTEYDRGFGVDPGLLLDAVQRRGMSYIGAYLWFDFLDEDAFAAQRDRLNDDLTLLSAIGCRHLIVSDRLRKHRVDLAGIVPEDRAASLSEEGYATLAANIHRLAERARDADINVHYHNHAGTYIETPWEVAELLKRLDREIVDLCFDTGHYAYGGGVAVDFLNDNLGHVGFVHLKDVDRSVLESARARHWSFLDALRHYVFSPLGQGSADIGGIVHALIANDFPHHVVIEQDTCEGDSTATARQNREFLVSWDRNSTKATQQGKPTMIAPRKDHAPMATEKLDELSRQTRRLILETVHTAGAGHIGGPLSVTDILVNLYFNTMNIDPANPYAEDRDRCILSKGHSSIAIYTVLALRGYFPVEELATFDEIDSRLQGHPDMSALPGLDMSTGSLGQGLSPGIGMALGARLSKKSFHTWVILGDGEIQEGQIWEAAFTAGRFRLDNLTAIVDYNRLPQFGWPDEEGFTRVEPIDDLGKKFAAFGWNVVEINGHDHLALSGAFLKARNVQYKPTCIIAHTVKGKGVSFMENDFNWHATVPDGTQLERALAELPGEADR